MLTENRRDVTPCADRKASHNVGLPSGYPGKEGNPYRKTFLTASHVGNGSNCRIARRRI
jgi:hypothetical protein